MCVYVRVCGCVCIHVYICVHMYVYVRMCVCAFVSVCIFRMLCFMSMCRCGWVDAALDEFTYRRLHFDHTCLSTHMFVSVSYVSVSLSVSTPPLCLCLSCHIGPTRSAGLHIYTSVQSRPPTRRAETASTFTGLFCSLAGLFCHTPFDRLCNLGQQHAVLKVPAH